MIKMSEISFQPKTETALARSAESTTNTGVAGSTGLFNSVLGEFQAKGMTTSLSLDGTESDQSDQKLIQLEDIEFSATTRQVNTLPAEDELSDSIVNALNTDLDVVENDEAPLIAIRPTLEADLADADEPVMRRAQSAADTDLEGLQYRPVKSDDQEAIKTDLEGLEYRSTKSVDQVASEADLAGSQYRSVISDDQEAIKTDLEGLEYRSPKSVDQVASEADLEGSQYRSVKSVDQVVSEADLEGSQYRSVKSVDQVASDADLEGSQYRSVKSVDQAAIEADLEGSQYRSVKSDNQEPIETGMRPVSLSELRSVQPESPRSRHSAKLDTTAVGEIGGKIADKAIDMDKLSIKQPYNESVDVEEPILVDKFEIDKKLANNSAKPDAAEMKVESLLGSAKESSVALDSRVVKSMSHTPISIQSMNGNMELSGIASAGLKTDVALPVGTLALRQPGLDQSLAKNISFMINEDIQSANINVKPVELGPVSVQLAVRADHLSVTIAASQVQTRESLESTLPRLREQFASMGFSSVDVNIGDHPSQRQSHESPLGNGTGYNPSSNGYLDTDDSSNIDDVRSLLPSRVTHNGMLDTFA